MPQEATKEIAVSGEQETITGSFDAFGYLLTRTDAMEAGLRKEIQATRTELKEEISGVRQEIGGVRQELKQEISDVRQEIGGVRQELRAVTRWAIGIFITLIAGFIAVIIPLLRLL
ncbi:MAG: hypothetical protein D9V47_10885 [Clostridia bacterium]|nr:MAG: hypothetical protein D9V47_10885 [Clostridia bacterium]